MTRQLLAFSMIHPTAPCTRSASADESLLIANKRDHHALSEYNQCFKLTALISHTTPCLNNRGDQLTLVSSEDEATPAAVIAVPGGLRDSQHREASPIRVGGGDDTKCFSIESFHGTFSAECVVRRAAKALEVLGALLTDRKLESPAGHDLVECVRTHLRHWSRGEQRRSLSSVHTCLPVRLDTSEQARQAFFGVGTGDQIQVEGRQATVLGATRHSVWVCVEGAWPISTCAAALRQRLGMWKSAMLGEDTEGKSRRHAVRDQEKADTGVADSAGAQCTKPTASPRFHTGKRQGSKILPWSRRTLRQVLDYAEDFILTRRTTPATPFERKGLATRAEDERGDADRGVPVTSMAVALWDLLTTNDELRSALSKWTPGMDEELRRRLDEVTESSAGAGPLDLPLNALENLPSCPELFPLTSGLAPAHVWARAALLVYVNDLVLPLIRLVDASPDACRPLGMSIRKCRYLLLKEEKVALLGA